MYKKVSGIYTITNKIDNKVYIGYSDSVYSRLNNHKNNLLKNKHINSYLQNAWNKYGEDNFKFEILEEYDKEFLQSMENYWCNMLNAHNRKYGYNIEPTNPERRIIAEETKLKIAEANRNKIVSQETRIKQGNSRRGKKHTQETKDKIANNNRIRSISEETRLKMSESAKKRIEKYGHNVELMNKANPKKNKNK